MALDVGPGEAAVILRGQLVAGCSGPAGTPSIRTSTLSSGSSPTRTVASRREILFVTLGSFGATSFDGQVAAALEQAVSRSAPRRLASRNTSARNQGNSSNASASSPARHLPPLRLHRPRRLREHVSTEPVYEMLWDCRHCGSKKLLGLTHRHRPQCGAPQNPSERYFPSEDEKVAVQNHVYYGADRLSSLLPESEQPQQQALRDVRGSARRGNRRPATRGTVSRGRRLCRRNRRRRAARAHESARRKSGGSQAKEPRSPSWWARCSGSCSR